ncbi:AMP-dependent synthetase/ligase [Halorientalis marina]|uniref:AMP-dependent synthetase/ligase n=1 Tax=Halorientalis marina TaxID=2931976 RepID=UPI001FF4A540|nr:long-chain fatty acid--CoA ligase [Halorientalis marina]
MVDTEDLLGREAEYSDSVTGTGTIPELFASVAERHADDPAQRYKGGVYDRSLAPAVVPEAPDGEYATLTYEEMHDVVKALAAGFRDIGVEPDDRIGIFANTRMEWAQTDFALLAAGGIVTTLFTESSASQVEYLLADSGAVGIVVENQELLERVLEVKDDVEVEFVVLMDDEPVAANHDSIYTLADLYERGQALISETRYMSFLDERGPDDLASLIYTSGTTGDPKGVKLTHHNFRENVSQVRKRYSPRPDKDDDVPTLDADSLTLSFLPLAHSFERTAGHFTMFAAGATVAYAESTDTIQADMQAVAPTTMTSVPRVYERMFDAMRERAGSGRSRRTFEWAMDVARACGRSDSPGLGLRLKRSLANRLVYSKVKSRMGGNIEMVVSGGGTLDTELTELFHGMGIKLCEGYGLTEAAPVVTGNPAEDMRPGQLGPPLPGIETKLDESVVEEDIRELADGPVGELLVTGPNVTEGYWQDPDRTAAAFEGTRETLTNGDERWLRTGDIVEESDDGYLVYHDRIKEIIVLTTGRNVAPRPIEEAFATKESIDQIMVIGDDRTFISALIVPNAEAIKRWGEREGHDLPMRIVDLIEHETVHAFVQRAIDEVNEDLAEHERIQEFELLPMEWTPGNDMLTASLKKKRRNIREKFSDRIADIYGEKTPAK